MYMSYFIFFLRTVLLTQSIILFIILLLFQISIHWVGDQLEISKNTIFESINDKYYMLILKGLRYDLLKEDIKIIQ